MGFLAGKRAVIVGLASTRSIAWGIAQALRAQGAELAFNYQTEKLKSRVEKMAADLDSDIALPLDVTEDDQIQDFFGDAIINGSFGDLSVDQISNNFNTLNIILDNSEAVLTLPKAAFNFYSNASNSMMKYPKGLTLDVSKRYDNEVANGYYAQKNSNKTINLVATFSDVVLK